MSQKVSTFIPWVAGVIDARAHLRLENRRDQPQPRIRVTTSKLPLLRELARLTATQVRVDDKGYSRKACGTHCDSKHIHIVAQSSYWNVDCTRATIVLHNCLPHLRAQNPEALTLLEVGYRTYQPNRNGTASRMLALGWSLPSPELLASPTLQASHLAGASAQSR